MGAADSLHPQQLALFQVPETEPVDVSNWARQNEWHASRSALLPTEEPEHRKAADDVLDKRTGLPWSPGNGHPLGFHAGTAWAAVERAAESGYGLRGGLHPVRVRGDNATPQDGSSEAMLEDGFPTTDDGWLWSDDAANGGDPEATRAVRGGKNVWYQNDSEDEQSISVRAPRQNVHTWSEHVMRHADEHSLAEIRAAKRGADLIYVIGSLDEALRRNNQATALRRAEIAKPGKIPPGLTASPITVHPEGKNAELVDIAMDERNDSDNYYDQLAARYTKTLTPIFTYRRREQEIARRRQEVAQDRFLARQKQPRLPGMEIP